MYYHLIKDILPITSIPYKQGFHFINSPSFKGSTDAGNISIEKLIDKSGKKITSKDQLTKVLANETE